MKDDKVSKLVSDLKEALEETMTNDDVVFVCIGTDRSTGDALAPLVGSKLQQLGYNNVVGSLEHNCNACNLVERVASIEKGKTIIAIDACLGKLSSVGDIRAFKGSVKAGEGVGKTHLPEVGDYGIIGVVNVGGFMEYFVLQNTRLSVVMRMADDIVEAIKQVFPLKIEAVA